MNRQHFSKKQIANGELERFLKILMDVSYGTGDYYNDIHIIPSDCGSFDMEWEQVPWNHQFGGRFEFLTEGQVVMEEFTFPDNHIEMCFDEQDFKERLNAWLVENPGWYQNSWGMWTKKEEQEVCENEEDK